MVRRVRSRTQTAILEPHVVAFVALGVNRREWDACSASRSLPCGHEALRSSSQFAPTATSASVRCSRLRSSLLGWRLGVTARFLVAGVTSFRCVLVIVFASQQSLLLVQYTFYEQWRGDLATMVSEFCRLPVVIRSADAGASGRAASLHDGHALDKRRRRYFH